jgi:hypothetical protein
MIQCIAGVLQYFLPQSASTKKPAIHWKAQTKENALFYPRQNYRIAYLLPASM